MARVTSRRQLTRRRAKAPVQHRRCTCLIKLDADEPVLVVKEAAGNEITFKPGYEDEKPCKDKDDCRTEKSYKWTIEKIDGNATLVVDNKEEAKVNTESGAHFKLCVTVTVTCWARVEPMKKPDNPTASIQTVAGRCQDSGCAEFLLM